MKIFTISAALLLAALDIASAAPAQPKARQFGTVITLEGAGPNPPSYTLSPPFDGSTFAIGTSTAL